MDLDYLIDDYGFKEVAEEEGSSYVRTKLKETDGALGVIVCTKFDPSTSTLTVNHDVIEYDKSITEVEVLRAIIISENAMRKFLSVVEEC